jgi:hypothetical protein
LAFRFQKQIKLAPGLRLNISKSGFSLSIGPRGASITIGRRGVYRNLGIPGTGVSHRTRIRPPARPQASSAKVTSAKTAKQPEGEGQNKARLDAILNNLREHGS